MAFIHEILSVFKRECTETDTVFIIPLMKTLNIAPHSYLIDSEHGVLFQFMFYF